MTSVLRPLFRVLAALLIPALFLDTAVAAGAGSVAESVPGVSAGYRPPVEGPVVEPFRPPPRPWMAGNRGVDYSPPPGSHVRSAGAGVVTFAGPVAGALHVTVTHPDGLRTSYSFLASVAVVRGQPVDRGTVVGVSGETLHWGVRDPTGAYIDPLSLLDRPRSATLVPGGDDGAITSDPTARTSLAATVRGGVSRHGVGLRSAPRAELPGWAQKAVGFFEARGNRRAADADR